MNPNKKRHLTAILRHNLIYIVLFIYALLCIFVIISFDGTGDSGDSILHYLYAKYAPVHPQLYFDHWAKPVFVLLASPFAQFGFTGVKIFNSIASFFTIFFSCRIAQLLNLKNAIICALILIFSPLFFILTFSGLTEPLFAFFISISLWALLKHRYIAACILISFLPFIRSEGLIILGVFGIYFLLVKKWKYLPWLLLGHVAYSLAGFFVYSDLLWVFKKIPYAHMGSTYGSGKLFHFVEQLMYVTGVPIYILFWLGIISISWRLIKRRTIPELSIIVFMGFASFFIAHSLFWYFGIFNSMGLKRVLVGVSPFISIISLEGFNFIIEKSLNSRRKLKLIAIGLLVGYIMIFPFTSNPAAIKPERDLSLLADQKSAEMTADFIKHNLQAEHCFVYAHPYLGEVLNIDHFDSRKHLELNQEVIEHLK